MSRYKAFVWFWFKLGFEQALEILQIEKDEINEFAELDEIMKFLNNDGEINIRKVFEKCWKIFKKMGLIKKTLKIDGSIASKEMEVLFDSRAGMSVIRKDIAEEICNIHYYDNPIPMILADGKTKINAIGSCNFGTEINKCLIEDTARVVDELNNNMIIGARTLQIYNLNLRFTKKKSEIDTSEYKIC